MLADARTNLVNCSGGDAGNSHAISRHECQRPIRHRSKLVPEAGARRVQPLGFHTASAPPCGLPR